MKRFKFFSILLPILVVLLTTASFTGCERSSAQSVSKLPSAPTRVYTAEDMQSVMSRNGINTGTFITPIPIMSQLKGSGYKSNFLLGCPLSSFKWE